MSEEDKTKERDVPDNETTTTTTEAPTHQEPSQKEPEQESKKTATQSEPDDSKVDVKELESAQARIRELNKENEKRRLQIREWEELDVNPETVKQWQKDVREAEEKRKREEGRFEELLQEMRDQTEQEKQRIASESEEKLGKMKNTVEKYLVDKTIAETLSSEGVKAPKLLSRYMKDFVRTVEDENGEYQAVVLDEKGEVRTKRGGSNLSVEDFVQELKKTDEFASVFPAPSVSGTGSENTTSKASGSQAPKKPRSQMSAKEKADFQRNYGFDEYYKLPIN